MHNNNYGGSLAHVLNCFETYCTCKSILPTPLKNDESTTKVNNIKFSLHHLFLRNHFNLFRDISKVKETQY